MPSRFYTETDRAAVTTRPEPYPTRPRRFEDSKIVVDSMVRQPGRVVIDGKLPEKKPLLDEKPSERRLEEDERRTAGKDVADGWPTTTSGDSRARFLFKKSAEYWVDEKVIQVTPYLHVIHDPVDGTVDIKRKNMQGGETVFIIPDIFLGELILTLRRCSHEIENHIHEIKILPALQYLSGHTDFYTKSWWDCCWQVNTYYKYIFIISIARYVICYVAPRSTLYHSGHIEMHMVTLFGSINLCQTKKGTSQYNTILILPWTLQSPWTME